MGTTYENLREKGYRESPQGPVINSDVPDFVERLISGKIRFAVMPGEEVPEARLNSYPNYPENAFKDNYVVFRKTSQ